VARVDALGGAERVRLREWRRSKHRRSEAQGGRQSFATLQVPVSHLHEVVMRMPPVVAQATHEKVLFKLNWLTATGTGILVAAIIAGWFMRFSVSDFAENLPRDAMARALFADHHCRDAGTRQPD